MDVRAGSGGGVMNDDMDRLIREVSRIADNLSSFSAICTTVYYVALALVLGVLLTLIGCTS